MPKFMCMFMYIKITSKKGQQIKYYMNLNSDSQLIITIKTKHLACGKVNIRFDYNVLFWF